MYVKPGYSRARGRIRRRRDGEKSRKQKKRKTRRNTITFDRRARTTARSSAMTKDRGRRASNNARVPFFAPLSKLKRADASRSARQQRCKRELRRRDGEKSRAQKQRKTRKITITFEGRARTTARSFAMTKIADEGLPTTRAFLF